MVLNNILVLIQFCSQLLPYAASVVRVVSSYFKKCSLPELRIKLYSITKTLLKSMGVGNFSQDLPLCFAFFISQLEVMKIKILFCAITLVL